MNYELEIIEFLRDKEDMYVFSVTENSRMGSYESEPFSFDKKILDSLMELYNEGEDPFEIIKSDVNTYCFNLNDVEIKAKYVDMKFPTMKNNLNILKKRNEKMVEESRKMFEDIRNMIEENKNALENSKNITESMDDEEIEALKNVIIEAKLKNDNESMESVTKVDNLSSLEEKGKEILKNIYQNIESLSKNIKSFLSDANNN